MKKTKKVFEYLINLLFTICVVGCIFICIQIFLFSSFKIPSDSMKPGLFAGDNILVSKPFIGARLFNLFDALDNKEVQIYRIPGMRKIQHNDIIVFNFPHRNSWDRIEMDIMRYYVKRCIAIPSDTLRVVNGIFNVNSSSMQVGNREAQQNISNRTKESFSDEVYNVFPFDPALNWTIKDFGPLYIPRKGDRINLNHSTYCLYKKVIEWEQKTNLTYNDDEIVLMDGQSITSYTFKKNYYFVVGDRTEDSQDSRYWGLLPEEFIVGKAWIVWKSIDPHSGEFRWDRFLKKVS